MNTDTRRVVTFMAIGVIVAVALGVGVWRTSAPDSRVAQGAQLSNAALAESPSAATSAQSSTKASHRASTTSSRSAQRASTSTAKTSKHRTHNPQAMLANDPFLAPNAVVNAQPQQADPTVYYRPDNITAESNPAVGNTAVGSTPHTGSSPAGSTGPGGTTGSAAPHTSNPGTRPAEPTPIDPGEDETAVPAPSTSETIRDGAPAPEPSETDNATVTGQAGEPAETTTPAHTLQRQPAATEPESTPQLTPSTAG